MSSFGDRVGVTNGFLKLPHVTPRSDADHAANARELERVVNNIPAGAPAKVYYGDVENVDGDGTPKPITVLGASNTPVSFGLPAGVTQIQVLLLFQATGALTGYGFSAADAVQGTVVGANLSLLADLGGNNYTASYGVFIDADFPQEVQFEVSVFSDTPGVTADVQWTITVTPGIRG